MPWEGLLHRLESLKGARIRGTGSADLREVLDAELRGLPSLPILELILGDAAMMTLSEGSFPFRLNRPVPMCPLETLPCSNLEEAKDIPVLAAGGSGHGQKIKTALLPGASGAVLGTRFVATQESLAHPEYKSAILRAHATDTALSVCLQDGWPSATHRALRNRTFERWEAAGCPSVGRRPGELSPRRSSASSRSRRSKSMWLS